MTYTKCGFVLCILYVRNGGRYGALRIRAGKHVRAFLAATTTYRRFVQKVQWGQADVKDAILLAPAEVGGGAMVKTPRALGEAVRTALDNQLHTGWTSSDGILLQATSLISADY
jgi:hypothetical protein